MARNVELLLREHVQDLGKCGDIVKVSPGYARNFLLPRRLAIQATEDNKKSMARRRSILDAEEAKRNAEIDAFVASLSTVEISTKGKADEHGHLYGSVNAAAIVVLLESNGHKVDEKAVRLDAPIKQVGTHTVKVHVHGDKHAEIKLTVEAE